MTESNSSPGAGATGSSDQRDEAHRPSDDESASQQRIEESGEPERDRLGNEDGSS